MTVSNRFSHRTYKTRYTVITAIIIFFFAIIAVRLWYMQVVKGDYYKHLSENNRIRLKTVKAARGIIFDRTGEILIDNHPYFNLAIIPENVKDTDLLLDTLSSIISIDTESLKEKIHDVRFKPTFKPVMLIENLSREKLSKIEANKLSLPGIEIIVESIRYYPQKNIASHIIGYLGEIDSIKLKSEEYKEYKSGDLVGNFGIEKTYESLLKGKDGLNEVEIDAFGRQLSTRTLMKAQAGNMLYLTLNARLQNFVEGIFEGKSGAVVVMDVNNGQILSQYSKPNFDPSLFVKGISARDWKVLSENPLHPLQNKVIAGQYSPGSIFKLIIAAAALEEGVIAKKSTFYCNGTFRLGTSRFSCWKKWGHGKLDLVEAITQSCDVYFYNTSTILGIDTIAEYAHKFGLGETTGIDLEYEKRGLIPTKKWKERTLKSRWFPGETVSVAIGQSYVLITPLQAALFTAAIANGKYIYVPQLLKNVKNADGTVIKEYSPKIKKNLNISKATIEILQESMFKVINSGKGTARGSKPLAVTAAGKTGTVQVFSEKKSSFPKGKKLPYALRDHAWFVSYAPAENPQIAISVLVEHGGHGSSAAAPIAKKIIDYYFKVILEGKDNV